MPARSLTLDPGRSSLAVRTRATGMLARLAHDLEVRAARLAGHAERDDDGAFRGELEIDVAGLEVAGVVRHGAVDAGVLSASDRAEITDRMRKDAFRGASSVRVTARGTSPGRAELTIAIDGREARANAPLSTQESDGAVSVRGE
ncbi:MAG TPA: hypothetical protein VHB21_14465, partial [Minicystis sp.]|nr:hypothetical protein [Minicystis sp.]